MATKTVDEKLLFEAYDATPNNARWRAFERNCVVHGGTVTDDEGWSFADVFSGAHDGGRNGTPIPNAAPWNAFATAAGAATARKCYRKRIKGAAAFLARHISNAAMHEKMAAPALQGVGT